MLDFPGGLPLNSTYRSNVSISSSPDHGLKAKHLEAQGWSHIASDFGFYGAEPKSADRVDALVSAAVARNGSTNLWKNDLAELPRRAEEMDPQHTFFGPVNYYWFEKVSE